VTIAAGGRERFGVGGFAQLTTVRPSGIATEILARWPDVIGRPIDPFAVAA
jgi:hypothetical protein